MSKRKLQPAHVPGPPGDTQRGAPGADDSLLIAKALIPLGVTDATEEAWSTEGAEALEAALGLATLRMDYEPVTFRVDGIKYTPDFMHVLSDSTIAFVEVKASHFGKSYGASRVRTRAAAGRYGMFAFYEALRDKKSWKITRVT